MSRHVHCASCGLRIRRVNEFPWIKFWTADFRRVCRQCAHSPAGVA